MNIHIEFCVKWNYEPEFERVSNLIYSLNENVNISSNKDGHRIGSFEVTINNSIVFSKLDTNRFPSDNEIKSWI